MAAPEPIGYNVNVESQHLRRSESLWFVLPAILLVAIVLYVLVLVAVGAEATKIRGDAVPLLAAALLGGLAALIGWRRDRRLAHAAREAEAEVRERLEEEEETHRQVADSHGQLESTLADRQDALEGVRERLEAESEERASVAGDRDELRSTLEQRESEIEQARSEVERRTHEHGEERERLERSVRERDEALEHERSLRGRVQKARGAEREWARELRDQLVQMHRERGALASTDDVPSLVLHTAVTLLQAEKGLLFSSEDADGDGALDLMRWEGFEHDPRESSVAHRFASDVIEQDTTIREDSRAELEGSNPADGEIENLVAIPIYIQDNFAGVVVCANRQGGFEEFDDQVLISLGDHAGAVLQNGRLHGELRSAYLATVRMLAEAIQAKDPFLRGHSDEVSTYVAAVAERLGLQPGRREELVFGSLLHDVGKIGISERILLKPGPLTPEERNLCELHPRIGYRLVQQVPALRPIAPAVLHHHERFDGDGYPAGLRGEQIPLEARVVAVADSFSAMTADRPYRGRMSLADACIELERCAGTQFDPEIVRVFVEEVRRRPLTDQESAVSSAFDDPELEARRTGDEPVLGSGAFAITDNLTLLYSHRYVHEVAGAQAEQAGIQGHPFSVVLVELEGIGETNRMRGYAAGDEAIQSVARAVQRYAQQQGGTAARFSGRRLCLIAPGVDAEGSERLVAQMIEEMGEGPEVRVAVATWSRGDSGEAVLERARRGLQGVPVHGNGARSGEPVRLEGAAGAGTVVSPAS